MSKRVKVWLIVATALILVGCMIFAGVMTVLKWDFKKLSTIKYETNTYVITDVFTHISVTGDTVADITFVPSHDDTVSVVCYEQKNLTHTVAVEGETLSIKVNDTRKWYHYVGINFGGPTITVYLPKGAYGALSVKTSTGDVVIPKDFTFSDVNIKVSTGDVTCCATSLGGMQIKTSTGDIRLSDLSADSVDLSVSTGKITVSSVACEGDVRVSVSTGKSKLTDVTCRNLTSTGDTGDITLKNVVATDAFSIERSTGDVHFDACDAAALTVTTDTGDITGTLLTAKVFVTSTDTGRVSVPDSTVGGKCKLTTDTGDIKITIE